MAAHPRPFLNPPLLNSQKYFASQFYINYIITYFVQLINYSMATANPLRGDNYELELSRVREKIKTKFVELIDCLKARESELLRELDNILSSYLSYRSELEKLSDRKIEIEETKILPPE